MARTLSRRRFGQLSTAGGLGYLFTGPASSVSKVYGANEKLRVAGIGIGGKGSSDIDQASKLMEVVALCDIDDNAVAAKKKLWADAKTFSDYRKMYDDAELMRTIDAVTVSTADHHHALAAAFAIRNKKHVYCQKPLTHSVFEAHLLKKLAKEHGVCTQMGNQGTALPGLRRAVELVQSGILGTVKECHVWTDRPREYWKQSPVLTKRPEGTFPVPKNIHWDTFLGPAPERPYAPGYTPSVWRGWWDFGTGAIGDMACHTANMAFMALKLGSPNHVKAESGEVNPETAPAWAHVMLDFPARGELAPVTLHWYEGKNGEKKMLPPEELLAKAVPAGTKLVGSGSILVGDKAILYSPSDYGGSCIITPKPDEANLTKPEKLAAYNGNNDQNQKNEWVAAIKAGKPSIALSNFDYSAMLAAAFLLGNVAIRTGKPFDFDGEKLTASIPEAAQYIKREYRKGWDMLEKM